jgi:hypothetical protein
VAVVTFEGWVRIVDLPIGSEVRDGDLGGEAQLLAIPSKWGFLIAVIADEIVVITVNGVIIDRHKMSWTIVAWWKFPTPNHFHYIVFLTEERTIGTFKGLHPDKNGLFQEAMITLATVLFDRMSKSFIFVSEDGKLVGVPFMPDGF